VSNLTRCQVKFLGAERRRPSAGFSMICGKKGLQTDQEFFKTLDINFRNSWNPPTASPKPTTHVKSLLKKGTSSLLIGAAAAGLGFFGPSIQARPSRRHRFWWL